MNKNTMTFPMHIRIKPARFNDIWRGMKQDKAYWCFPIIGIVFFAANFIFLSGFMLHSANLTDTGDMVFLVTILSLIPLLMICFLCSMFYYPERCGSLSLGNNVRFRYASSIPVPIRCSYEEVKYIYLGDCPFRFMCWPFGNPHRGYDNGRSLPLFREYYGEKYIVACNDVSPLFVLTWNETAYRMLLERCLKAIAFENEESYIAYMDKKREIANSINRKKECPVLNNYDGYPN